MYDIIIIGAGPAGLTAAIYAARAEKRVLLLEKETFGGQITYSPKVENYPGFISVSGNEIADKFLEQAMALGVDVELCEATSVSDIGEFKLVKTTGGDYSTNAVIIATGSKHRRLGLDKEEEFIGEGISYCAVCDGAFYKGKRVAVIGGGNTALQDALLLSERCSHVTIVQNLPTLTGEASLISALKLRSNVSYIYNTVVWELVGDTSLKAIKLRDVNTGKITDFETDGVFVAIGQVPENEPFKSVAPLDKNGYIISGENCTLETPGIFVAGDCRTKNVRQVTTATADGAAAALAAVRFIDNI
ncbi:MAG: FAD-dependent oxidoreductase [Clostridia bacterium]|nr:FAD-dependent oxidoreductase [Clostridia bacterium]